MPGQATLNPVPRLLIFDVDGTLTDTLDLMVAVMEGAIQAIGHPLPPAELIRRSLGINLGQTIRSLLPSASPEEVEAIEAWYRSHYVPEERRRGLRLFPGVRQTLFRLQQRGFLMALATGKSHGGVERVLEALELASCFPVRRTAERTQEKPHPQMLQEILAECRLTAPDAVMVGDTTFDLEMARNAGVRSVAVTYGAHPRTLLADFSPVAWIDSFPALLPLLGM